MEKNEKEVPRVIENVAKIDESVKKESQLIAFRADFESSKRIEILEGETNKSKTEVIKETIRTAFNGLLIKATLEKLCPIIKKEFKGAKITQSDWGTHREEDEEHPINNSQDVGMVFFELPEYKEFKCGDNIKSGLQGLMLELNVEGLKTIKLDITKLIIAAEITKIDANLLKELQIIAHTKNFELKSSKFDKNLMTFEFKIEQEIIIGEKKCEDNFNKSIKSLHEAMNDIVKMSCFKKEK